MAFPESPSVGDVYSEDGYVYFYNGNTWSAGWGSTYPGGDIVAHHIAPPEPAAGLLWLNVLTNEVKRFNGATWDQVGNIGV